MAHSHSLLDHLLFLLLFLFFLPLLLSWSAVPISDCLQAHSRAGSYPQRWRPSYRFALNSLPPVRMSQQRGPCPPGFKAPLEGHTSKTRGSPPKCEMTERRKEEWWVMTYLPRISLPSTYLPITEPDLCFLLALEAAVFALAALSFCRNTKCPEIHACGFILMLEQKRGKALDRTLNGRSRAGFLPTTPHIQFIHPLPCIPPPTHTATRIPPSPFQKST